MDIIFSSDTIPSQGIFVIGLTEEGGLPTEIAKLDKKTGSAITKAIDVKQFKGKKGEIVSILAPHGTKLDAIILVGFGKEKELDNNRLHALGGTIATQLNQHKFKIAAVYFVPTKKMKLSIAQTASMLAFGAKLKTYRFDKYRTKEKAEEKPTLKQLSFVVDSEKEAQVEFKYWQKLAEGMYLTRDLVSEPPNVLYPESMAERCKELSKLGIDIEILGVKEMRKLGMGALLGVGQGSVREPRLVVMSWNGAPKSSKQQPIAFLGKGVTFDTGGISIKPSNGMEDMKYDMGGAGVVIGLMHALAARKAKVNVIGIVGLAENMPDGNAQRPSDVVTSMSGQTIEVLNTDAEGRLVLADALWYCQERFKPRFMVNLATLTGAITITFGSLYAGLFSNDDEFAERLLASGQKVEEKLWRLPLNDAYDKMLQSDIADMQNISNEKGAGSITAAQFLKRFVNNTPWAHLDIAGVTWARKDNEITPKGATAFGVRLLNQLIVDYYEG